MNLRFEMDSKLAGMVLGKVFEKAADTLVQAFCERADDLYG
jgi:ribosome-associated toxin RatA of RatAB toxin-antitoxin module